MIKKEKQKLETNEMRQEFDENKNEVHYFDKETDIEYWYKYDKNGNLIYYKNSVGDEVWTEYDENNNEIYYKNNYDEEIWRTFDYNNNLIHLKRSDGYKIWYKYEFISGKQIEITKREFEEKYSHITIEKKLLKDGVEKALE